MLPVRPGRTIAHRRTALEKEISHALEHGDEVALAMISRHVGTPELVYEHVRTLSTHTSRWIQGTRNVEHSALWLMPVVTRTGSAATNVRTPTTVTSPSALLGHWLQDWFLMQTRARCYEYLPCYSAIASMSPHLVRTALEGLAQRDNPVRVEFFGPSPEVQAQVQAGLPDLAYLVGAVSCMGGAPIIPPAGRPNDLPFVERMTSVLSMCASEPKCVGARYRIAVPAPFSEALCTGLRMWVQEVADQFVTVTWDAFPNGNGNVTLKWVVTNKDSGIQSEISRHLQMAQLGEKNIQAVLCEVDAKTGHRVNHHDRS